MTRVLSLTCIAFSVAAIAAPVYAEHNNSNNSQRSCAAKAKGAYGFQCHGFISPAGGALEPVTFVGTVEGTADAFYEGFGTFNSSLGSSSTHVAGQATFDARCFGRVVYSTNEILLPGGGTVPLPPAIFDFVSVYGGDEILGTGVAPGATGNAVPRLTCRLVKIRG